MIWTYPTSASGWNNNELAFDGDHDTWASISGSADTWTVFIYLYIDPPIISDRVRFHSWKYDSDDEVRLDVHVDGEWVTVQNGSDWTGAGFNERTFNQGEVDQARFRYKPDHSDNPRLREFAFGEIETAEEEAAAYSFIM